MAQERMAQYCFRMPEELLRQVDQYAAKLSKSTGLRVTKNAALRLLLQNALKQEKKNGGR